jgi:hypothetical protein
MNTIFEGKNLKMYTTNALVQKLIKPYGKIGESYRIECRNYSYDKPLWEKIKKQILSYINIASLKDIVRELLMQNSHREKSTMLYFGVRLFYDKAPTKSCKSLNRRIPISATHLENVEYGRDLVNKSVKLLHDLICRILISPLT